MLIFKGILNQFFTNLGYDAESSIVDDVTVNEKLNSGRSSGNGPPDFWLLCHLTDACINIYFHERFDQSLNKLKAVV